MLFDKVLPVFLKRIVRFTIAQNYPLLKDRQTKREGCKPLRFAIIFSTLSLSEIPLCLQTEKVIIA